MTGPSLGLQKTKLVNGQACDWNPKNLAVKKHGLCKCPDHDDNTDDAPKRTEVRLVMQWSDEYRKHLGMTYSNDDEFDKGYDAVDNIRWKYGTEEYWCDRCIEESSE